MAQKLPNIFRYIVSAILAGVFVFAPAVALAQQDANCTIDGRPGVRVSVPIDGSVTGQNCVPIGGGTLEDNILFRYLIAIIQFVAVGVGFGVVAGIVVGGYMYMTARANAAQTERGRDIIANSVVGLLLYIFMYTILEFLIPGSIFKL